MIEEPKETVVFAFSDKPVRVIWILRDGKMVSDQIVRFEDLVLPEE